VGQSPPQLAKHAAAVATAVAREKMRTTTQLGWPMVARTLDRLIRREKEGGNGFIAPLTAARLAAAHFVEKRKKQQKVKNRKYVKIIFSEINVIISEIHAYF